jgi:hypothetical protein
MTKKRSLRALAALAFAVAVVALPREASAQVSFQGTFVGPHGAFSIGFGHPSYAIGAYVPYGYTVVHQPTYGYGFWSPVFSCGAHHVHHRHWVPVKRHHSRWVVLERPVHAHAAGPYRPYRYDDEWRGNGHGKKHKHKKHGPKHGGYYRY